MQKNHALTPSSCTQGMLAKCRRDLAATKVLRDNDLVNVQVVRSKLADKTRQLDRLQAQTQVQTQTQPGRTSPQHHHHHRRPGSYLERRGTVDLFTAAKVAALEQRALELEQRNSDLVLQLGGAVPAGSSSSSSHSSSIDVLNRGVAHEAWRETVAALQHDVKAKDAEIARLRRGSGSGSGTTASGVPTGEPMDWYRIEALLEEHAGYRESVGGRLQALRSEKEVLLKELHGRENACQVLELRVQTLQRRGNVG